MSRRIPDRHQPGCGVGHVFHTGAVAQLCSRFQQDGTPCTNMTDNPDGWCRRDCHGFQRRTQNAAPASSGAPRGTAKHIASSIDVEIGRLDVADVLEVRISTRATDSFRFHHGGSVDLADM